VIRSSIKQRRSFWPELSNDIIISENQGDIWSLGVVLNTILAEKPKCRVKVSEKLRDLVK
jgi:hypothetical protein